MKDVTILIAAHKKYRMPEDPMYLPLQAGAALSSEDFGFVRDDSGDNISAKNKTYCELSALYWGWKNLDSDYTGLVHYRRYFALRKENPLKKEDPFARILKYEELEPMLYHYALFVPVKRRYYIETLYSHYGHTHYADQLDLVRRIIEERLPEYLSVWDKAVNRTWGYMFNMMIMRRDLLDEYCTWLFAILGEVESRYDSSALDDYQARMYGRISEILLNVWLEKQLETGRIRKDQIKELPVVYTESINLVKKGSSFLKAKLFHQKYDRSF